MCDPHSTGCVKVEALLDTGTDITIVKPEKIDEFDNVASLPVPVVRHIAIGGVFQPAHDLAFFFPDSNLPHSSEYGMISPLGWDFDVADVWLGQDLLNKFIVTLDGPRGTVSIYDSAGGKKRASTTKQKAKSSVQKRNKL